MSGQHLLTSPVYNEAQIPLAFCPFNITSFYSTASLLHLCSVPFPLLLYPFHLLFATYKFSRFLFDSGCLSTSWCDVSRILSSVNHGEAGAGTSGSLNSNHFSPSPAFLLLAFPWLAAMARPGNLTARKRRVQGLQPHYAKHRRECTFSSSYTTIQLGHRMIVETRRKLWEHTKDEMTTEGILRRCWDGTGVGWQKKKEKGELRKDRYWSQRYKQQL